MKINRSLVFYFIGGDGEKLTAEAATVGAKLSED